MVEGTIEKANGFDTSTVGLISAEGLRRDSFVAVGRAGADLAGNALASAELADVGVTSGEKILPPLVIDTHASIPALGLAGDNSLESRQHALDDLVAQMPKSVFSGPRSGIQVRTLKWLGEFAAAAATGDLKFDAHGIYDNLARAGFHPALIVLDSNINESYMGKFLIGDAMQRLKAGQPLPSDFAQSVDYYLAPAPAATEPLRMLGNIPDDITNTKLAKSGTINAVANADIGKVVESFSHPTANGTLRNALNNPSVADTVTTLSSTSSIKSPWSSASELNQSLMPDEIRLKSFSSRPQTYHTPEKLELLGKIGIVASVGLALSAVITLAKKYHAEPTATAPRTPFFSTSY